MSRRLPDKPPKRLSGGTPSAITACSCSAFFQDSRTSGQSMRRSPRRAGHRRGSVCAPGRWELLVNRPPSIPSTHQAAGRSSATPGPRCSTPNSGRRHCCRPAMSSGFIPSRTGRAARSRASRRGEQSTTAPRSITVIEPGLFTTVQDSGRWGHQSSGVPVSGAMDWIAYRTANAIVGNEPGTAALETTLARSEAALRPPNDVCDRRCRPRCHARRCARAALCAGVVSCGRRPPLLATRARGEGVYRRGRRDRRSARPREPVDALF